MRHSHFTFLSMSLLLHNQRIRSKFFMSVHKLPRFQLDTQIVRSRFMQNLSFSSPAKFCQTGPQSICGNWLSLSPSDFSSHLHSFWFRCECCSRCTPRPHTISSMPGKSCFKCVIFMIIPCFLATPPATKRMLIRCFWETDGALESPWSRQAHFRLKAARAVCSKMATQLNFCSAVSALQTHSRFWVVILKAFLTSEK